MTNSDDFNRQIFEGNQTICAALGFALSNFAVIEFNLLAIFDVLSGMSQEKSEAIFWSLGSTRSQVRTVDALAKVILKNSTLADDWKSLKGDIEKCIADRDGLAHGEVVPLSRAPGINETFYSPRFQKNLSKSKGSGPLDWQPLEKLTEEQMIELAHKFWLGGRRMTDFFDALKGQGF